jgi:hypothetical protein
VQTTQECTRLTKGQSLSNNNNNDNNNTNKKNNSKNNNNDECASGTPVEKEKDRKYSCSAKDNSKNITSQDSRG